MKTRFIFGTQFAVAMQAARDTKPHSLDIQYSYENSIRFWDRVRGSDANGKRHETGSLNLKDRSNWTNKTKLRSRLWCCSMI